MVGADIILSLLPHVNAYKFHQARLHLKRFGCRQQQHRRLITVPKEDHSITFISSPQLIQDVAY